MLKKLIKELSRGEFLHRSSSEKNHSCWLPHGYRGDVWKCKCGKVWKCLGLSMFAEVIMWKEIKEEDIKSDIDESEIF